MRIAQITPGVIPIPPNGWGAVEKIIWEYTQVLRRLGHHVEILYADEVKTGEWDIVHVHMANLALFLHDRGIPYVFSHHDHHAFHFGKDSDVYRQNRKAIENSVLTFVHAKYLVDYFDVPEKVRYLTHGANLQDYPFSDRSKQLFSEKPKLVMMANNGLGGNKLYDRKGFGVGVEAAKKLELPISIICKKEGNQQIIDGLVKYEKLKVFYDLDYKDSIRILQEHHIFLNPSMLEAGHPNLTVTESISMGIPVVGTSEFEIPGMRSVDLIDLQVDRDELAERINHVIHEYSTLVLECKNHRGMLSWEVIVSKMLMDYSKFCGITQRQQLLENYSTLTIEKNKLTGGSGYYTRFNPTPYVYKAIATKSDVSISFVDQRTDKVVHKSIMGKNPRSWVTPPSFADNFIAWKILVKKGRKIVFEDELNLEEKHVLVTGTENLGPEFYAQLEEFAKQTKSIVSLDSNVSGHPFFHFTGTGREFFYAVFNPNQIRDFFVVKQKHPKKIFLEFSPGSLGDNLAFVPYAAELAKKVGEKIYVKAAHSDLFEGIYSNLEFVKDTDCTEYSLINYLFDQPLQQGFASQLGLEFEEIRPQIRKPRKTDPQIKGRYICFSTHSTAQAKHWNNNQGWEKLCDELKKVGITPVCIDRYRTFGSAPNWNEIPKNCVDKTGGDLDQMMDLISGCDFFVGLSSGLSWLAHAMGKKVVMISGVTTPDNEFTVDCLRIHRDDVCNSCFNLPSEHTFDASNWMWCPVHQGTGRQFECTKKISAKQVMDSIHQAGWIYSRP